MQALKLSRITTPDQPHALDVKMQNLLLLNCLWQDCHTISGGLVHGISAFSLLQAVARRNVGLGDRGSILSAQIGALGLLTSFDQWVQGIYGSTIGHAIAAYPLDGDNPKQLSGRYRLEAVPI